MVREARAENTRELLLKIRFFPNVVTIAKTSECDLPAPESILHLLHLLSERYGKEMKNILLTADNGQHPDMIIFLNGRHIEFIDGLESKLSNDDTITFFSRIAGG